MLDRNFNEIDLRAMLEKASGYRPDIVQGTMVDRHQIQTAEMGSYRRTR
jgi:hypothetical protein